MKKKLVGVSFVTYFILDMIREIRYRKKVAVIEFAVQTAVIFIVFTCINMVISRDKNPWYYNLGSAVFVSMTQRVFEYIHQLKKQEKC